MKTLEREQICGFRKSGSLVPLRHTRGQFDIGLRMKSILIRRDVFKHLLGVFSKFESDIKAFMELSWYDQFVATPEPEVDGETELLEDDADIRTEVSTFASKLPLTRLCTKLAKGHFELSLCKIAMLACNDIMVLLLNCHCKIFELRKESVPGKSLNLTKDDGLQKQIDGLREKYTFLGFQISFVFTVRRCAPKLRADFPPAATVTSPQSSVRHEYLEVQTGTDILNESDYLDELAKFNQQATQHENRMLQEHLACKHFLWPTFCIASSSQVFGCPCRMADLEQ